MTSPNEPGQPGPGERLVGAEGLPDLPPWLGPRGDAAPQRAAAEAPVRTAPRPEPTVKPAGPRVTRYVTGTAAPDLSALGPRPEPAPVRVESRTERTDVAAPLEAYPSELPNLSAEAPRPPQPKPVAAEPIRAADPTSRIQVGHRARGPVRANLQIRRIDPWSALKVSGLLSGALFFVWMIAVAFLYLVLGAMGVWSKLNNNVGDLLTSGSGGGGELVSAGSIFGVAALIGLVNIVLLTAMATLGAYIYNLITDIVGGVEVTLADLD